MLYVLHVVTTINTDFSFFKFILNIFTLKREVALTTMEIISYRVNVSWTSRYIVV